jgi:hypothetical protein
MRLIVGVLPVILSVVAWGESSSITHLALQVGSSGLQRLFVSQTGFFLNRSALNTSPVILKVPTSGSKSLRVAPLNTMPRIISMKCAASTS